MTTTNIIQNFTALRIYINDYYKHNTKTLQLFAYTQMTTTNIIQKLYSSSHTHK